MKKLLVIIISIILGLGLWACKPASGQAGDTDRRVGTIVITGSPTLGQIMTRLALEYEEAYGSWDQVNATFPKEDIKIVISGGGTGAGISSVIEGTANFGLVSRYVSESEQAKFRHFHQYALGVDALTISVHPDNPVHEIQDSFSLEDLRQIFSGAYRYWDQVNPALAHEEIVVVTRDISGGAHQVFQEKVMGDLEVSVEAIQAPSMGALVTKVMENRHAIAYASYGVVNQNAGKIIPMAVEGVEASKENILTGRYVISRPLLLLANGELSPQEEALLEFLTSQRSAELFSEGGFVVSD